MADRSLTCTTGKYVLTGNAVTLDAGDRTPRVIGEWISLDAAMEMLDAPSDQEDFVTLLILEITAALTNYLGRQLLDAVHTDTFFRPSTELVLSNYPIISIHSIRSDGVRLDSSDQFRINVALGNIYPNISTWSSSNWRSEQVTVNYEAGIVPPPPEIQSVFRAILADYYAAGGSTQGSVGRVKKVAMPGVASVEFESSGITYSGIDKQLGVPQPFKQYVGLLDVYKSNSTMGVV